jgi:F-type H+-transporting ATPase subunit delta
MSKSGAEKRYAIALFELAKEQHQVAEIEQELLVVKQVFSENNFKQFLNHRSCPFRTNRH